MTPTTTPRQRQLPFDQLYIEARKETRLAKIERLLGTTPKLTTAAKLFDYQESSAIAEGKR